MDLHARKIEFVQEFLKLQSEETITMLELVMKHQESGAAGNFNPMTVIELNARIDKSENDFKNGSYKTAKELLAKYR